MNHDNQAIYAAKQRLRDLAKFDLDTLPAEQLQSAVNLIVRLGADRLLDVQQPTLLCPWLGLTFDTIYIGVEPDGYAHS